MDFTEEPDDMSWLSCEETSSVSQCNWFTNGVHLCARVPFVDHHAGSPHSCMCDFTWEDDVHVIEQHTVFIESGGDSLTTM